MTSERSGDNGTQGDADSVRASAVARADPAFMYVHYLDEHSPSHRYPMYLFQIDGSDLAVQLSSAIDDIVEGRAHKVPRGDNEVQRWRVYSYVVFVLKDEEITSVDFTDEWGGDGTYTLREIGSLPEHNGHYSMVFVNRRFDGRGRPLSIWDNEKFDWVINHREPNHESSTTNTGP